MPHDDIAVGDAGAQAPYAIEHSSEVLAWLRQIERQAAAVKLWAAGGAGMRTTIWQVDAQRRSLVLDAAPAGAALAELIASSDVTAVAQLDQVRLQFDLRELMLVHGADSSALQAPLPSRLYRFQRRDAFRVDPRAATPPAAQFRHPALPEMRLALRVLDLSTLGCALLLPDDLPAIAAGITIAGVRLRLDAATAFDATLEVLHVSTIRPGAPGRRVGCALAAMSGPATRMLQRWIDRTQRRRRPFGG